MRKDLDFYKSLSSLIEVLKLIAAAQYQNLEKKIIYYTVYLQSLEDFFSLVDIQKAHHAFISQTNKPKGVIALTTDAGLLGGLNALVMNKALGYSAQEDSKLIIIGKRGQLYVEKRKMVFANFPGVKTEHRFKQALKLRDYLVENVRSGRLGEVKIVFPRALSFTMQRIETLQLLPFIPDTQKRPLNLAWSDVILESKFNNLVEYLIYLWLGQKIFEIFGMSQLAEQAARFMHLENCTQRIKDLDRKLKFQYFRARHEIVDQNMRELYAARMLS